MNRDIIIQASFSSESMTSWSRSLVLGSTVGVVFLASLFGSPSSSSAPPMTGRRHS